MRVFLVGIILGTAVTFLTTGCGSHDELDSSADTFSIGGRRLSEGQVAGYLKAAGFPQNVIPQMVCTAKYESSFYTGATNQNNNGTRDTGLFQINDVHLGDTCDATRTSLLDPLVNARCALKIYRLQGLNAWYGYQYHRSECNSYHAVTPVSIGASGEGCDQDALEVCLAHGGGNACYPKTGCKK